MSYTIKILILVLSLLSVTLTGRAQSREDGSHWNRHSIHISYSDGSTLGMSSFFGVGLSDALTGTVRTRQQATGVYSIGYRYAVSRRFQGGLEIGFARQTSLAVTAAEGLPAVQEREMDLLLLPTADFIYFKRKIFTLYGSVAAGVAFNRHFETQLPVNGKGGFTKRSAFNSQFAFQFNPLAFRIGSDRIGGLFETGLGHKGFMTIGLYLKC